MSDSDSGELFKGLFFGLLLGVGLSWFLKTEEGEAVKKRFQKDGGKFLSQFRERLNQAVAEGYSDMEES